MGVRQEIFAGHGVPARGHGLTAPSATARGAQCATGSAAIQHPAPDHAALPSLRGLLFDLGNVLYDATQWRRWRARLWPRLAVDVDFESFCHAWEDEYLVDVHRGRRDFAEAFQDLLLSVGVPWAQIDEIEAASQIQRQELDADARPFPGVASTLERLSADGLALGLLTDSALPAARVEEQLERLGLGHRFAVVLSSVDLEATMPDGVCYRAALAALDLQPTEAAFVGHDAESLAGATEAGLRAIAFNHERHARADVYLSRFDELVEVVAAWNAAPVAC